MNQTIFEHLELNFEKKKIYAHCLENKPSLSLSLGTTIKRVKLKYNNIFINKLVNKMA